MQKVFEKIIERLENEMFSAELYGDQWNGQTVTNLLCLGNVRDVIEQAAAEYNNGWIPVEERPPEDGEEILATDGKYVYLVEYDTELDASFGDVDGIVAWQPLPGPYQPEGE